MSNKKLWLIIVGLIVISTVLILLIKRNSIDDNNSITPTTTMTPTSEPTATTIPTPTPRVYTDEIISFEIPEGWELADSIPEKFVGNFFGYQCTGVTLVNEDDEETLIVVDPSSEGEEGICTTSSWGLRFDRTVNENTTFGYRIDTKKVKISERLESGFYTEGEWQGDYISHVWYNSNYDGQVPLYPDKTHVLVYYIYNGENEYQQDYLMVLETLELK